MNSELVMNKQAYRAITHRPHISSGHAIVAEIHDALYTDRLDLPALPDIVLTFQGFPADPHAHVFADSIVKLLPSDQTISTHIIRAANNPVWSNGAPVGNLRDAVSNLGLRMLRSLTMNIAMARLFQARSPSVNQQLRELLAHSREVAANSYVLAQMHKHLDPEQALLAGLVHDIGALPLYLYADRYHSRLEQTTLEYLIHRFSDDIGTRLLQGWNFPDELVEVIGEHKNLQRNSNSGLPDYADVVTMANLQMPGTARLVAWKDVHAAARLGYSAADCQYFLSSNADRLAAIRGMLEIGATL